jgi:conjugal transfer pilus assembly protein TraF
MVISKYFMSTFILLLMVNIPIFGQQSTWYAGDQKGWLWYKSRPPLDFVEKALLRKADERNSKTTKKDAEPTLYPHTKRLEQARKNFEEILAKAVLEPTLENVQLMQQAQNVLMVRGNQFEKLWMISSLLSGQNFQSSDQSNPQHRKIHQEQQTFELDQKIKQLSKSFGLFFIFKQDCPYCHEFAPIVKELINIFGFECKAISNDGTPLSLFPEAEKDNGTIGIINPDGIFPSLFLVNPQTRQVIPLARGLVNLSQLRENFKIIIQYLEEKSHAR